MRRYVSAGLVAAVALLAVPPRVPAAGDVTAAVTDGALFLTGDDAPNAVTISGTGADGVFLLEGALGTTVNGAASVELSGVQRLSLKPGGGSDDLVLLQATVNGPVTVRLSDGDDTLTVDQSRLRGRLNVRGSGGSDVVRVQGRTRVDGRIVIRTQRGTDTILIEDADADANVTLSGGPGDDRVDVRDVRGGSIARLRIDGGDGEDDVRIDFADIRDDVLVFLGDDDDTLLLEDSSFGREAEFRGGDGDNWLVLDGFLDFDFSERVVFDDF